MAAGVRSPGQADPNEPMPHSSEDSIALLLQALGQPTATLDQSTISTSTTTLLAHEPHQPAVVDGQYEGRLVSSHKP